MTPKSVLCTCTGIQLLTYGCIRLTSGSFCRIEYAPERPEWQIEKHRFYVELPGISADFEAAERLKALARCRMSCLCGHVHLWALRAHRLLRLFVLTGDLWEEGEMMRLMKSNMAFIGEDGRMPYENLLRVGQVRPELVVVDPNDS